MKKMYNNVFFNIILLLPVGISGAKLYNLFVFSKKKWLFVMKNTILLINCYHAYT